MEITKFLALLVIVGALILSDQRVLGAPDKCDKDYKQFENLCSKNFKRTLFPKPKGLRKECCIKIKEIGLDCICRHVTSDFEQKNDMENFVAVVRCGVPIPPRTKCGSYTVQK
ncbi:hypothetical protein M5689_003384 [Euphorbia peplus]|nr:hypothetical protein M5689_003384 [Euphorbia peplus]